MSVSSRHIVHQAPVIAALGRSVIGAAVRRLRKDKGEIPALPGPELVHAVSPRPKALVRDYIRHVGGDPSAYRGTLPAHLFPQWSFALATRVLEGLPYPLERVLNAGCRMDIRAPLAADQSLTVRVRLESIDDDGRRALLCTRVVTGTADEPDALVAHLYALVPLARGSGSKKESARVPDDARELAYFRIGADAGLSFAKLTGDFNPVHWVPAYARAFGFPACILHGFSTMARAIEGLNRGLFSGNVQALSMIDVRFTRPLVLPASVGLYVKSDEVFVGDAPGARAYLTGRFS
ncbi:MAG TPA: MaoC/PaaZ C-terminal domain-containing protein [Polyangiaceae bacterium]|jgi:acyl dehydratase|nr:MaoC/PaaZ C-terminal domain-containing protein [Polyangiaceae bacterium]